MLQYYRLFLERDAGVAGLDSSVVAMATPMTSRLFYAIYLRKP